MALPNSVIKGQDYLAIATFYANAITSNLNSVEYLYDAVYRITLSDQLIPTKELINEFYDSYNINASIYRSPSTYLSAVRAINNHILNRSGSSVQDLDDYLVAENIRVPLAWADLCKATGVLICRQRIQNSPTVYGDGTPTPTCS